jgi:hypothetical protein
VLAGDAFAVAGGEAVLELLGASFQRRMVNIWKSMTRLRSWPMRSRRSSGSRMLVISREISLRTVRVWAWRETRV